MYICIRGGGPLQVLKVLEGTGTVLRTGIFDPMGSGSYSCYCLSIAYRLPLMHICGPSS